ncbi:MAG: Gfo/Idh/MocA family oxidoreductase [Planctomycetes bacterium]|nr:Gfo/Idh/MocA family oxidoreductase [Planctomycetota bacterium]
MSTATVNIAIISTAHCHTQAFIDALAKTADGRKLYAIWDDVADRGKRFADKAGVTFVSDLDRLIADPQVHGFLICAENTRHLPLLERTLPAGKPVFCEKPLVTNREELAKVTKLVSQYGTTLFAGYYLPYDGTMRAIAAKIQAGDLGKITHASYSNAHHASYGHWFDSSDVAWFTNGELSGGGAFMDMGTHAVQFLRTLFGPAQSVLATISNRSGIYPKVDDFGIAHIEFASGVLATVEANWICQGGRGGLEVHGSKGAIWNDGKQYVFGVPGSEPTAIAPIEARPKQVDRLIAAVRGTIAGEELRADLAACIDAVTIMEAAYASNASGSKVTLAAPGAATARAS